MPITIKKRGNAAKKQQETRIESAAQKAAAFLSVHRKTLKPAAALLAAVALIVAGYLFIQSGRNREASVLLTTAYGYYNPSGTGAPDYAGALDLYRDIQKKYSGTASAATAQYYIGNCLAGLGKTDEALKEYQYFVKRYSSEKLLLGFVYQRMGYAYAALGNQGEAVKSFERSESVEGPGFATVELARIYEREGKTEESLKKYRTILEKLQGTQWAAEAMAKMRVPAAAPQAGRVIEEK
jgi:tetratricopeptide (TPR) repeat protein